MNKIMSFIEEWWMIPPIIFVILQLFITVPQALLMILGLIGFVIAITIIVAMMITIKWLLSKCF